MKKRKRERGGGNKGSGKGERGRGRGRERGGEGEKEEEGEEQREEEGEGKKEVEPITKNTTAVFVVYILQIHLPRWFSPTKKTVLLRLQYYDYFYHSHSKKYHSSNRSIIFIPHFIIKLLW